MPNSENLQSAGTVSYLKKHENKRKEKINAQEKI